MYIKKNNNPFSFFYSTSLVENLKFHFTHKICDNCWFKFENFNKDSAFTLVQE